MHDVAVDWELIFKDVVSIEETRNERTMDVRGKCRGSVKYREVAEEMSRW